MKIAVFDVCGTLYDANTTFDFLDSYFCENKKYRFFRKISGLFPVKILNHYVYKYFKLDMIRVYATGFLKNNSIEDIAVYSKSFVNEHLSKKVNKDIVFMLEEYKKSGYKIILMSGSYEFIVKEVGVYFDVEHFYASKLETKNNVYTGKYEQDLLLSKYQLLSEEFPNITELIVVSDNKTDLDLMLAANHAYAVCNKKKHYKFWEQINNDKITILENHV